MSGPLALPLVSLLHYSITFANIVNSFMTHVRINKARAFQVKAIGPTLGESNSIIYIVCRHCLQFYNAQVYDQGEGMFVSGPLVPLW